MARALLFISSIYLSLTTAGHCQNLLEGFTFQVLAPPSQDKTVRFDRIVGDERKNNSQNRLSMISESQNDYAAPESGCGPSVIDQDDQGTRLEHSARQTASQFSLRRHTQ